MKATLWSKTVGRLFGGEIRRQVRAGLAAETDATFTLGASSTGGQQQRPSAPNRQRFSSNAGGLAVNPLGVGWFELTTISGGWGHRHPVQNAPPRAS